MQPSDSGPVCHVRSSTVLQAATEPYPPAAHTHLQLGTANVCFTNRSRNTGNVRLNCANVHETFVVSNVTDVFRNQSSQVLLEDAGK